MLMKTIYLPNVIPKGVKQDNQKGKEVNWSQLVVSCTRYGTRLKIFVVLKKLYASGHEFLLVYSVLLFFLCLGYLQVKYQVPINTNNLRGNKSTFNPFKKLDQMQNSTSLISSQELELWIGNTCMDLHMNMWTKILMLTDADEIATRFHINKNMRKSLRNRGWQKKILRVGYHLKRLL